MVKVAKKITHKQARYYLHGKAGGTLTPSQHTMLEGYLEECAACSNFEVELSIVEKYVRNVLRSHWATINGPLTTPPLIVQSRLRSKR